MIKGNKLIFVPVGVIALVYLLTVWQPECLFGPSEPGNAAREAVIENMQTLAVSGLSAVLSLLIPIELKCRVKEKKWRERLRIGAIVLLTAILMVALGLIATSTANYPWWANLALSVCVGVFLTMLNDFE